MTVFNSPIEIDVKCASEKALKGSKVIWVLGAIDGRRHAMLQELVTPNVHSIDFNEIMGSKSPEKLVGRSTIFVCEHGITSLFVAQKLRKEGIEAFSIEGGVDDMLKW
jgi:rhodanese-related sulfurtransferase